MLNTGSDEADITSLGRPLNGFSVVVVAAQRVSWLSNNSIDKISTDSASRGPSVAAELPVDIKKVAHTPLPSVVPEPIPVLGSQPAGDVSHKPGGRLLQQQERHDLR